MVKSHLVIAEFSIVPIGTGETSVSRFVAAAVDSFKSIKGLEFELTPMGTILAAENLDVVLEAVRMAHNAVASLGAKRVSSTLRIDDRMDKARSIHDKVDAVNRRLREP